MEHKPTVNSDLISSTVESLPLLPLRDTVVFPNIMIPLFVGRKSSILAIESAMLENKEIALVAQKDQKINAPSVDDLYEVGTKAKIIQILKLPDNTIKLLVEGRKRVFIKSLNHNDKFFSVEYSNLETLYESVTETALLSKTLVSRFENYINLSSKPASEIIASLSNIKDYEILADTVSAHLDLSLNIKQQLLSEVNLNNRIEKLLVHLEHLIQILSLDKKIKNRVKTQMDNSQKEYYLNEKLKAIQKELGAINPELSEIDNLEKRIKKLNLPKEVREKAGQEITKLKSMSPMSAEATVTRTYLDWIVKVPWRKEDDISSDIKAGEQELEKNHFGLKAVKERVIEYLSVQKRVKAQTGQILCLVGPPGVGKTSLGESIAKATNRKFIRIALGGVRDEAEIRGHRKTYIGAMPGTIMQKIIKCKAKNPLIMLDEIDKMSMDYRGDPASALLEVLDPSQNKAFNDHYLELDFDLSKVMFIATANSLDIPEALYDRMEILRLAGYTESEKYNITKNHILSRQFSNHKLTEKELNISPDAILEIIRCYTKEAGVRSLEREIAKICRKAVHQIESKAKTSIKITKTNLHKYLGVKKFSFGVKPDSNKVGQVNGLAWTSVGGELLKIESTKFAGTGKAMFTGKLGEIMKESINIALSVVKSRAKQFNIDESVFKQSDFHIHVPEGATPKDGPSAGIGMCLAIASLVTNIEVRSDIAMTGELTLAGEVLPIGGLKEKLLAALRAGIKEVIIPLENKKDLQDIPVEVKKGLIITPTDEINKVFTKALVNWPITVD